jgi:hypothetical protein
MATAHLIGFDLRLDPLTAARAWTPDRRLRFLLREDVAEPLSVDPMVWPSRFWQPHVPPGMGIPQRLGTVAVPALTPGYTHLGVWDSLERLDGFAAASRVARLPRLLIAVLAWPGDHATDLGSSVAVPSDLEAWTSLGFDVADTSFVSGLVNCGYEPGEQIVLGERFASDLNESGLLTTLDAAFEFRDLTDARVLEHAPFVVFELRSAPWQATADSESGE